MDKTTTGLGKFAPLGALFTVFGGIFLIGGALMMLGVITGSATDTQSIFLLVFGLILVILGKVVKGLKPAARREENSLMAHGYEGNITMLERELWTTAAKKASVIFTSDGPKGEFLQFACQGLYLLDLPAHQLTPEKNRRFMELAPNASRNKYQGGYSYQESFKDAHSAAEFADLVFRDVFGLGENYKIKHVERV